MALIRNNHTTALGIGGVMIPAKSEADVSNWQAVHDRSAVIKAWTKRGILTVVEAEVETVEPAAQVDHDDAERARLFAALAELGIRPGGRTGNDKLRAMLADAREAEANAEAENSSLPESSAETASAGDF